MNKIKERISVVFPVYNEETIIEKTITDYYNEFKGKFTFEMIIREDGSIDKTKEILKRLSKEFPIRVYTSNARKGYQWSVIDALKYAKYEWIFLVDSDYQYKPEDFWRLASYIGKYDIILGRRVKRMDSWHRILMSKSFNSLIRMMFHVPYMDIEPGYRLLKKSVIKKIIPSLNCLSYFTAELVIRAHNMGYKIIEVPVSHLKRKKGATNVFKIYKIPNIVIREFIGIFKLMSEISKLKNKRNNF